MARVRCFGAAVVLLIFMVTSLFIGAAEASAASFTLDAAPAKTAYHIGETVLLNGKLTWQGVARNISLTFQLWNSTAKIADLGAYTVSTANGSQSLQWTVNGLTGKAGAKSYIVRAVEATTGLTIAQDTVSITVQDRSIVMSVAWADASNDRQIDPQETVTFTVYVSWAFFNQTENMILKVTDQGFEKILDAVQLTAGSGSVSVQYVTGFETPGMKTLIFRLEDSEGRLAAGKTVTVTVGGTGQPTVETSSWLENINVAVQKYAGIMLLLVVITLILVAWKLKR